MRLAALYPVLFLMLTPAFSATSPSSAIRYTVRFPAPQTHYAEVEMTFAAGQPSIELMMAVWTPGSYLVREYARNVEGVEAHSGAGAPLAVEKIRKNRWRIAVNGAPEVTVRYKLYCREMSVRSNWVESGFALLNGAPTFLTLPDGLSRPHMVTVELPAGWKTSFSGMPLAGGLPHHYEAPNYDVLVDSPILAGNPSIYEFEVDGKNHYLANEGEAGVWDGPKSVHDVEKIVREYARMWGSLPYDRYVFINLLMESEGGLEHRNSTVLMSSRFATRSKAAYFGNPEGPNPVGGWLNLVSHEYFHLWNVKRLRPQELGPFDYENEVYTKNLWIAEGFTEYYGTLALVRAGLTHRDDYLAALSATIQEVEGAPGRLSQPVDMASFDAWIKAYRPNENSINSTINYYNKGAVIAFLLDAHIRKLTGGQKNLDDLMKLAFSRFSGAQGFTQADFRKVASEIAGMNIENWFTQPVETASELDYQEALEWFGLRLRPADPPAAGREPVGWLGARTRNDNGRLIVTQVLRGTPAYDAGLDADDEIVAFDDNRVRPDQWETRLSQYRPGDRVTLLISRRDLLQRIPVVFGSEPPPKKLDVDPAANDVQKQHLKAWLVLP